MENLLKTALLIASGGAALVAGEATPAAGVSLESPRLAKQAPYVISVVRSDPKSGRLVRVVVSRAPVQPDPTVVAAIEETARNLQVSPELVHSVIQVESNYNPYAVSPKGAEGLMQLMPATARRFGVTNSFDARQNIEGGVRYLKFLRETFQDDRLAIAAYNAGEKAVARYGGVPPYPETVNYVAKVGQKYSQAKKSSEKGKMEAKAAAGAPTAKPGEIDLKPADAAANPGDVSAKPGEEQERHVSAYLDAEGRLHIETR